MQRLRVRVLMITDDKKGYRPFVASRIKFSSKDRIRRPDKELKTQRRFGDSPFRRFSIS